MQSQPLTGQQELLRCLAAIDAGDFSVTLGSGDGVSPEVAELMNSILAKLNGICDGITVVARELGTEGRFGGRMSVPNARGTWLDLIDNVNFMSMNLTTQFRSLAMGVTSFANGNFPRTVSVESRGEVAELRETLNTMSTQFDLYHSELSRIAREIGTEGKFGGQAEVPGVAGKWLDLMTEFNGMSANLTDQMRDMVRTSRLVVQGTPTQRVTVCAQGETLELKECINSLVDRATANTAR